MIFISGVAGFIGSHLANHLSLRGEKVIGFDLKSEKNPILEPNTLLYSGSTAQKDGLSPLFERHCVRQVLHLGMASQPAEAQANPEKAKESIIEGTRQMLDLSLRHQVETFIFFSSSHVYGDVEEAAISEEANCQPKSLYGKYKLEAEKLCLDMAHDSQMRVHIIRPTSVYGPHDPAERVVTKFVKKALKGETIEINDQDSRLDFTYIDDFTKGVYQLLQANLDTNQVFNLSRGQGRSLLELAKILKEEFPHLDVKLNDRSNGTKKGCLDISKAKHFFNYNPTINLEEGVKLLIKAYQ